MSPQELAERLCSLIALCGDVRSLSAVTDTHVVTVSEPSMWDYPKAIRPPLFGLDVSIREIDI